jgi:hypothetical protein
MRFGTVFSTLALAASAFANQDVKDTTSLQTALASTTSISVASGCSFSDPFTATAQADLDKLAGCQAIEGDIVITGVLGSASIANVKAIYGDLQIFNATNLQFFAADAITTITGSLKLHQLTVLSSLSFGSLTSVGAINWVTLPNLIDTGLTKVTDCNSILISDTMLSNLKGINPTNVEIFNINNNFNLASISSNIETISNALTVAFNGDNTIAEFDNLVWANNLTFYSVASISMASITAVNKSAGFFESAVEELLFPLITSIGADLTIENNDQLTYIDFSNVTSIGGGLVIANNTDLKSIENIDDIKTVQGAVVLKGDFDNCTMNSLKTVRGAFDLETSGYADCTPFQKLSKNGGIQGSFTCKAKAKAKSSSSSSGSSTKSSSTGTGTKTSTSTATDSSSSASVSSISSTSKGDAASLKNTSVFGTLVAVVLSFL